MTTGIISQEFDDSGKAYLTNKPKCGDDVYVNKHPHPVTTLNTYWAISSTKACPMKVGDVWRLAKETTNE